MDPHFNQRLSAQTLQIDGSRESLLFDQAEVEQFYLPIARWISPAKERPDRQIIAVAGPPGAGKSTFCAILATVLNTYHKAELSVVVGQDGWHFPNSFLSSHTVEKDGKTVALRSIKGMPESFNVKKFRAVLLKMRSAKLLRFPIYSRQTHDPIPNAGVINHNHKIILVEGNYLLLDHMPWSELHGLFDRKIFIQMPTAQLLDSLRSRHSSGGRDRAAVEQQIESVDRPNIELVLSASIQADLVVVKKNAQQIVKLNFIEQAGQPIVPGGG